MDVTKEMLAAIEDYEFDKIIWQARYGELAAEAEARFLEWFLEDESKIKQFSDSRYNYYKMMYDYFLEGGCDID